MKQYYEFLGIIPGTLAENEVPAVIKKITDFFIAQDGEISYQDNFGRKRMAYPVKHLRYGYYFLLELILAPEKLVSTEKKLRLEENLLRFLIIKTKPKSREEREKEKTRMQTPPDKDKREKKEYNKIENTQNKISLEELDKKLDEILADEKI